MNSKKKEANRVINPKALIIRTMLRWKYILLCTLIACMLAGLYAYKKDQKSEAVISSSATINSDYKTLINMFDDALADRYKYLENTMVKDMNPYSQPLATALLYVKDNSENGSFEYKLEQNTVGNYNLVAKNERGAVLTSALSNYILYGMNWDRIKESYNIDDEVLVDELVQTSIEGNILIVKAFNSTADGATELLNYVLENVETKFEELIDNLQYKDMELVLIDQNTGTKIFSNNFAWLTNRVTEISNIVDAKNKFINAYNSSMASMSEISNSSRGKKYIFKTAIKGGILGFLISLFIIMAYIVFSSKVLSARELIGNYDLNLLAVLPSRYKKKQMSGINNKISRFEKDNRSSMSENVHLELANLLIEKMDKTDEIAVISDAETSMVKNIVDELNILAENIHYDALLHVLDKTEERKKLAELNYAILIAGVEDSKYTEIDDLLILMDYYGIEVLGAIVC